MFLSASSTKGWPGEHHFFIEFRTGCEGVDIPAHLQVQYPDKMTIVLQNQFSDLQVDEDGFSVRLSFGGIASLLRVPFSAITTFADPSVEFALQYEVKLPARTKPGKKSIDEGSSQPSKADTVREGKAKASKEKPSGTVVQVDFRKK